MPLRNGKPLIFRPATVCDAMDGTNGPPGGMSALTNLIPSPSTDKQWVGRPAAEVITIFGGITPDPGFVSAMLVVGDLMYMMLATPLNFGFDEPVVFDLSTDTFQDVTGVLPGNVPLSPPSTGDWQPPILAQVGTRIIVTHPGYPNQKTDDFFGWFDISALSVGTVVSTTVNSPILSGNPSIEGLQPGLSVQGPDISAGATIASTALYVNDTTVTTNGDQFLTVVANMTGIAIGQAVAGLGIPTATFVTGVNFATSTVSISNAATTSAAGVAVTFSGATITITIPATGSNAFSPILVTGGYPKQVPGITVANSIAGFDNLTGNPRIAGLANGSPINGPVLLGNTTVLDTIPVQVTTFAQGVMGSQILTNVSTTANVAVGQLVAGFGIPSDAVVTSVDTVHSNVAISSPLVYPMAPGTVVTFYGAIIVLSQNADGSAQDVQFSFPNGFAAEPQWGAGNTNINPLPSPPVSVAQMAGSAFYAVGTAVVISDPLLPVQVTNANQVLTFQNGLPVTALGPLPLNSLLGGIVQAIIAFQGVTAMQQITGSPATANLAVNQMNVPTGTLAPLSIVPMMAGLAFVSPEGLRIIDFLARVGDPVGDAGKGVAIPFIYALHPSRICAAATADVLRISVQNNTPAALALAPPPTSPPFQEYWFDLTRKVWSGPHTFPASLIQAWRNTFVMTPIGVLGSVWQSDSKPMAASLFVENGVPMPFAWTTVLLPDNELMAENFMVETMLAFAMAPTQEITITAVDDLGLTLGTVILAANPSLFGQAVAGQAQFGGGNILAQYPIPWADGLHFKQMRLQAVGTLSAVNAVGNLYMRYQILGYPIGR